ncbi:MAG: COX15/CtaA family protein [Candidatus Polarisedimenticolia bacterium]
MNAGLHRLAVVTAAATLFLIFAGGMVTSTGSGLAVPDWPLSYGTLFPPMVGGIFYEHGHRMVAAAVGMLTVALAVWVFLRERRRWVGWLAATALSAVILQGGLGGLTVLLLLPPAVSILHACLAQAFFCLTVSLAVVTGTGWRDARPGDAKLAASSIVFVGVTFAQLILGAVMRHMKAGMAIPDFPLSFGQAIPPFTSPAIAVNFAHRAWGIVVAVVALRLAWRVFSASRGDAWTRRPALALAGLVPVQVMLGAITVWSARHPLLASLHVAGGAALLGTGVLLSLRLHRRAWVSSRSRDALGRPPMDERLPERIHGKGAPA